MKNLPTRMGYDQLEPEIQIRKALRSKVTQAPKRDLWVSVHQQTNGHFATSYAVIVDVK